MSVSAYAFNVYILKIRMYIMFCVRIKDIEKPLNNYAITLVSMLAAL